MRRNLNDRRTTGPLTFRQMEILAHISLGKTHRETAEAMGVSRVCVSENMCVAVAKMGVIHSWQAVGRYKAYLAYRNAAVLLRKEMPHDLTDPADEHVGHVIESLAVLLERHADKLLPQ